VPVGGIADFQKAQRIVGDFFVLEQSLLQPLARLAPQPASSTIQPIQQCRPDRSLDAAAG